jgi:hypothetical protein
MIVEDFRTVCSALVAKNIEKPVVFPDLMELCIF